MLAELRHRVSLKNPLHFLALGFGSGLANKAPGTFGTLAAIPLVIFLSIYTPLYGYLALCILFSFAGIWICGHTANDMQVHDDSSIVWDEVVGMMITMIAVPLNWQNLLVSMGYFFINYYSLQWNIFYTIR
jgi:phosphatidylglycerophosphatase A